MGIFTALKEITYGLKRGTSYSLTQRHGYVEKVANPGLHVKDPGH